MSSTAFFAVAKARKIFGSKRVQRYILDARPEKEHVEKAPNPQIPDGGSLREIILSEEDD